LDNAGVGKTILEKAIDDELLWLHRMVLPAYKPPVRQTPVLSQKQLTVFLGNRNLKTPVNARTLHPE
jgi:hypothetical protein